MIHERFPEMKKSKLICRRYKVGSVIAESYVHTNMECSAIECAQIKIHHQYFELGQLDNVASMKNVIYGKQS